MSIVWCRRGGGEGGKTREVVLEEAGVQACQREKLVIRG